MQRKTLAEAGISTTTANRYEQLVGSPEQEANAVVNAAADFTAKEHFNRHS